MVMACGGVLGWGGRTFLSIFGLRLVWGIGYSFGMIGGVEIKIFE